MKNLRNEFPVISQRTYLNTAATGLLSESVFEYRQDQNLDFLTLGSLFRDQTAGIYAEVREKIAAFFTAEANKVALTSSFSFGFNALLEGLPSKSKILLLQDDYPSINLAVEARDFEIVYAEITAQIEQNIAEKVAQEKPNVLVLSLVQYISGIKLDLDFLKKLKSEHPKLLIVADGTQYLGTEVFNFRESGIDVLGASAYKWLNAGFGNAFFMFKEHVSDRIYPKTIGFGSSIGKYKKEENSFIGKFEPGHLDTSNIGSLKVALTLQEKIGVKKIQQQLESLSEKAKEAFEELNLLVPAVAERKTHSTVFNIKGDEKLFRFLTEKNIICSQRGAGIRVSFHYYNTENDLEVLLKALRSFD